ncbi:MAG: tetratricopeptide repeat protein [Gemmataceae bacterium]|nr:tetratricopeptide repeat protein [Gemmataceae bacterium]
MRQLLTILLAFLGLGGSLCAGLYDPDQPVLDLAKEGPLQALPFDLFRGRMADVMVVGLATPETPLRKAALETRDKLKGAKTPAELIRRGIVRLKLREVDGALADLQQAYGRNPRNYWAVNVLGTAYLATGQASEAARYLEAAGDLVPADWPARAAAAPVEAALLKLARLRQREQLTRPGRRTPEAVDDLFGTQLNAPGAAKPPADAIAIVQQMLLWLPDDARLYWLLGELYRATDDLDSAIIILNECLDSRRFDTKELRESRQAVLAAIAARPVPAGPEWKPSETRWWLVAVVAGPVLLVLIWLQVRQIARRIKV